MISCRQPLEYQKKADILYVEWRDRKGLVQLGHDFPDKTFILFLAADAEINEQELTNYSMYCHHHLVCRVMSEEQRKYCIDVGVPYYFWKMIETYEELRAAQELGAWAVQITAPLTHDLENVHNSGMKIMVALNMAAFTYPSAESNPAGTWFRPEDQDIYSPYIDIACFGYEDLRQERGLYNLYSHTKTWHGQLKDLIIGLNYPGKNYMIPPTLTEKRLNCRQICKQNYNSCHYCQSVLDLANSTLLKKRNDEEEK